MKQIFLWLLIMPTLNYLLLKLNLLKLKGQAADEATVWKVERAGC